MRRALTFLLVLLVIPACLSCRQQVLLAAFGDSLTAGADWPLLLSLDIYPQNFGYGGETSWDGVDRLLAELPDLHADVVTLFWGTNDVTRAVWSVDDTLGPLTTAVDAVLADGKTPVVVVPPPVFRDFAVPQVTVNGRLNELQAAIIGLAAARGIEVAHLYLAFWFAPQLPEDPLALYIDYVHPNWAGRAIAATVIEETIQDALDWGS